MLSASAKFATLTLLAVTAACASQSSAPGIPGQDRNVITREQVMTPNYTTPYDAVQALRPTWLRAHGRDSFNNPSQPLVYLDNVKLGDVESLRSIDRNGIQYIRFYDGSSANTRWGVGHSAGVIFVSTAQ